MIDAYPLSWPVGWPRTLPSQRRSAKFSKGERQRPSTPTGSSWMRYRQVSVADGIQRVLAELAKLKISRDDLIVSSNLRLRLDGLPRSDQREPEDPGAAVYWQDQKGRKQVMAIDQYDRVADNLAAIAATLEAMRAIERHGGAQILERAFTGFVALPAPDHQRTWREVLVIPSLPGNEAQAREAVETAYRRLRSLHHPDKGGDAAAFSAVQAAYDQAIVELGL
ncbi:MAG: hypothetical protein Q7J84_13935 [Sulfuricaulis sp.]|nr:hypothetical protein [Sulfuricaulis sp.]